MSIQFNYSNNRLDDTVTCLGMYPCQHGDVCSMPQKKRTPPIHFRLQNHEGQGGPTCPAFNLIGLKLKTHDLIADITLNNQYAVSTGKRVFNDLTRQEATGRVPYQEFWK